MATETITAEFIEALPKTDLHVHLDGSIRVQTLIDLATEYGVALPATDEAGLKKTVFKDRYESLAEYLRPFGYCCAVLQSELALERVAMELGEDCQAEGVRYVEVRFAPQLHVHGHMSTVQVIKAVARGLQRAADEFNARAEVADGREPRFAFGIICSAMRMFTEGFSEYFAQLIHAHSYAPAKEVYRHASLELARAAVLARDRYGLPVVGLDLAGEEAGYPAGEHIDAFQFAHKNFLAKTVHAGEAYGPESIFQAITDLHAERIGHGTYLLDPTAIRDPAIVDKEAYVKKLGQYIADRRVTLEVCLTSNLQTNPQMKNLSEHPFRKLRDHRVSTTICTDNRTVSNTTVTRELQLAVEHFDLSRRDLRSILIYGFKRSFFAGTYQHKRAYVRQTIDYYNEVERRFFSEKASKG
mgnify:CR=1 FL=1